MQKKFLKTNGKLWIFQKITDLSKYPYLDSAAIKLLFKQQVYTLYSSEVPDVTVLECAIGQK